MADNIGYTPGSGAVIAADDVGGALLQRIKMVVGDDGVNDGDVSLAAVGQCHDGSKWFAPTNWTCATPEKPTQIGSWPIARVATTDWEQVAQVERIETPTDGTQ